MLITRVLFPVLLFTVGCCFLPVGASAQESTNFQGTSTSAIEEQARELVSKGSYAAATPYLREVYDRLKETDPDEQKMEAVYYYLGIGYLATNRIDQAIEILEAYEKRFGEQNLGGNLDNARMFLGDAYRSKNKFPEAIKTYTLLLNSSQRARDVLNYRLEILEKICEAYFYDRPDIQVKEKRPDGKEVTVTRQRDPEWDKAIPAFQTFIRESNDPTKIAHIGSYLLQAYSAKGMFDEALALIPILLVESPSRYDIAFNIALLMGGDRMYDSEKYSQASFFYALTLTKSQIDTYFKNRLAILKAQKTAIESRGAGGEERILELNKDISFAEIQLKTLEDIPDYTSLLKYRQARTFLGMERDWEAFWAFLRLWQELPNDQNTEEFLYTAFVQAVKVGQEKWALELGDAYQTNPKFTKYSEEVVVSLVQLYLNIGRNDEFRRLAEQYIRNNPPDSAAANQLVYLLGMHMMEQEMFTELDTLFGQLLRSKGPSSVYASGLLYWQGMSYLYTERYQDVAATMTRLTNDYPNSPYAEDGFFRIGVAEYGLGEFGKARAHFEKFIKDKPDSILRSEAEVFLGDISASESRMEEALGHYRNVEKYAHEEAGTAFITHAAFQAAKLLEANKKYNDMVLVLNHYINTYRDRGDISNAIYQLGRAYELAGDPDESLFVYFDAISRFGNIPGSFGIDYIIDAIPDKYRTVRGEYPISEFLELYNEAVSTESWPKVFRLEAALEKMGHSVSPTYAITPRVMEEASPGSLVYLGRRYTGDDLISETAYKLLQERYPDSDYVRFAYLDIGNKLAERGEYDKARELFNKLVNTYPITDEARIAALREGDMLVSLKRYDEASERFQDIQRTPSWRGGAHAEALFKRGLILFEQEKWPEAHALFQHVYLLYGSQKHWAAMAYLRAGESLERMGEIDKAKATYEDFMKKDNLADTEAFNEIRSRLTRI